MLRIGVLHCLRQSHVAGEARGAGKQHQEFVILADLDGLFRGDVVRRSIQQPRALQHAAG